MENKIKATKVKLPKGKTIAAPRPTSAAIFLAMMIVIVPLLCLYLISLLFSAGR